jgi:hypothetical protein
MHDGRNDHRALTGIPKPFTVANRRRILQAARKRKKLGAALEGRGGPCSWSRTSQHAPGVRCKYSIR